MISCEAYMSANGSSTTTEDVAEGDREGDGEGGGGGGAARRMLTGTDTLRTDPLLGLVTIGVGGGESVIEDEDEFEE